MKKTIWVIEQGTYSDYHVVGVFSSRKNAKVVFDKLKNSEWSDDASLNEWTLDPAVDNLNEGRLPYRVLMLRDGTVEDCHSNDVDAYNLHEDFTIWKRSTAPAYRGKGIPDALDAKVWATNEKHAVKIVNEHRTQMIATGKWL